MLTYLIKLKAHGREYLLLGKPSNEEEIMSGSSYLNIEYNKTLENNSITEVEEKYSSSPENRQKNASTDKNSPQLTRTLSSLATSTPKNEENERRIKNRSVSVNDLDSRSIKHFSIDDQTFEVKKKDAPKFSKENKLVDVSRIFWLIQTEYKPEDVAKSFLTLLSTNTGCLPDLVDGMVDLFGVIAAGKDKKVVSIEKKEDKRQLWIERFEQELVTLITYDVGIPLVCDFFRTIIPKNHTFNEIKVSQQIYQRLTEKNSLIKVLPIIIQYDLEKEYLDTLYRISSLTTKLFSIHATSLLKPQLDLILTFLKEKFQKVDTYVFVQQGIFFLPKKFQHFKELAEEFLKRIYQLKMPPQLNEFMNLRNQLIQKRFSSIEVNSSLLINIQNNSKSEFFLRAIIPFFLSPFSNQKELRYNQKESDIANYLSQVLQRLTNESRYEPINKLSPLNQIIDSHQSTYNQFIKEFLK